MFSFFSSKCAICKRKVDPYPALYKDPKGKKVKLCLECTLYAERRAYLKLN